MEEKGVEEVVATAEDHVASSDAAVTTTGQNKRKSKKEEPGKIVKKARNDSKRIPNIAQELAKNRNHVKGASPSPMIKLSSSPMPLVTDGKSIKSETDIDSEDQLLQNANAGKIKQLKISSLLSPNEELDQKLTPSRLADDKPGKLDSDLAPQSPSQQHRQLSNPPKVILPTQKPGGSALENNDSPDTPGVLIARISSPVNLPVEKFQGNLKRSHSTAAGMGSSKVAEREKKLNSFSALPSKAKAANVHESDAKKAQVSKSYKKENSAPTVSKSNLEKPNAARSSSEKGGEKKDTKKQISRSKDNSKSNPTNSKSLDVKKKSTVKKEATPSAKVKTPKKLVAAPAIKSPSLLEVFERGKVTKEVEDPTIVLDIPLYSTKDNEYLDENGQVTFNFYKLVHDSISSQNGNNVADVKAAKRNLLGQLNGNAGHVESTEDDDDDDIVEVDDDGDEDEEDEGEDEKATTSPKKRSHPNKGKSLIGKYDTEDPFIDDTELLWEEQRAATKDGFFVYFGPLIEKGHYASLERADGTMKRGGVKNK